MNCFSSFGIMLGRGGQNVNSMTYINKYAKSITADFSGIAFTDLSATSSYHVTSSGLNGNNGNNGNNDNSTFARLKYNDTGTFLKTADFNSGSFTIYLKHAARYSTLSPFNFQYPNLFRLSQSAVQSGSSFDVIFYSSLNPGTAVPYSFIGCSSVELSSAALTGTFIAPYQRTTYTFVKTSYIAFPTTTLSSTVLTITTYPVIYYDVTVVGGSYNFDGAANPINPVFTAGNIYIFRQNVENNVGNTLVFGSAVESTSYFSGMSVVFTAGSAGAYTMMDFSVLAVPTPLYYYSQTTPGMIYSIPIPYQTDRIVVLGNVDSRVDLPAQTIDGYLSCTFPNKSLAENPVNGELTGMDVDANNDIIFPMAYNLSYAKGSIQSSTTSSITLMYNTSPNGPSHPGETRTSGTYYCYIAKNMYHIRVCDGTTYVASIGTGVCTFCINKTATTIYALTDNSQYLYKYTGTNFGTAIQLSSTAENSTIAASSALSAARFGINMNISNQGIRTKTFSADSFETGNFTLRTSVRMTTDSSGNLFIFHDGVIRKVAATTDGVITETSTITTIAGTYGTLGNTIGATALESLIGGLIGIICDSRDVIYFLDRVPRNATTNESSGGSSTVNLKKLWTDGGIYKISLVRSDIPNSAVGSAIDKNNNIYIRGLTTVYKYAV